MLNQRKENQKLTLLASVAVLLLGLGAPGYGDGGGLQGNEKNIALETATDLLQSEYGKLATDTSFEEWVRGNPAQAHEALEIGLAECDRSDLLNDSDTMGALTNELLNLAPL